MSKRELIKELEQKQVQQWEYLINNHYKDQLNKAYIQSLHRIKECYNQDDQQECIDRELKRQQNLDKYLRKIVSTFEVGIEDCIQACKYSLKLEMDDCYIDCFTKISTIVNKVHKLE